MIKYRIYTKTGFEEYKELPNVESGTKIERIDFSIEKDEEGFDCVKINSIEDVSEES